MYVGNQVSFFGRFQTLNEGTIFRVQEALPLTGDYRTVAKALLEHLYAHAEDPRDWAEKESLDHLLIESV